jgi:phosphoglycerol transferase MdoB-like AlkP superfamily enzyme
VIPKEIHGLPVHALALHAAVVLIPLAALLALLFVIRRTRAWSAVAMALTSVAALVALFVTRESGFNLKNTLEAQGGGEAWEESPVGKAVYHHEHLANLLFVLFIVFTVVVLVVFFLYRRADGFRGPLEYVACTVLVIGALVVAFQTYRVGEAGSKAVWNPTGDQSYSSAVVGQ